MKNNEVIDLAIKRHDIDADWFQRAYNQGNNRNSLPFLYGRKLVLDELERVLKDLAPGSKILDVGSGTGHLTSWLKEKGYIVEGVEPSEEMLGFAFKNFPNIVFKKGVSSALPFKDQEFDLIVSFEVLRYLNENVNKQTYQEFFRVLKPNGKVFITHVNKYSFDFYYFYYFIKGLVYSIFKITYHYCYFTTPSKEEKIAKLAGFSKVNSVGRMDSQLRIANKFGKFVFNWYRKISEMLYADQRFLKNPFKAFAGHLILICSK